MLSAEEQNHRWGKIPEGAYIALGLDIGTHKIGIASGQSMLGTASPHTNIKANNAAPAWAEFETVLKQWQPKLIVIGWPLNMDDSPTFLTPACERAANKIHGRYGVSVRCVDERLSTREAYDIALSANNSTWKNKAVDGLAAAVILETWFNSYSN
mgnify:CR=1 FL=1